MRGGSNGFFKKMKGEIVLLPWSPPHVGDKGNPAARCALFRGVVLERNAAVTASTWRSSRLSVCHRVSGSSPSSAGACWLHICPLVHRTHGVIQASSMAVWLFTQPPGCCCCFVSLSLCVCVFVSRLLPNSTSYKQKRASEPVRLVAFAVFIPPPFMRRPSSSSSVCRLAVIERSASESRCSPPTERRSLSPSPPPLPPPRRPMERRGAEGARIRWYESGVGPQTCQSHGSGANRGVRRTESAKIS